MPRLRNFEESKTSSRHDADAGSDIDEGDAESTALLGTKRPLGEPEVTRRFWFSQVKSNPGNDIATQVRTYSPGTISLQAHTNCRP